MHHTAKYVMQNLNGKFPTLYNELIKLKGIGDYSAAAISSFSTNQAHAVVDGNVVRVLSRVFAIKEDFQTASGKKVFKNIAVRVLPQNKAGSYNQAIMDFGALQCVPRNPDCSVCILSSLCYAYNNQKVNLLPFKRKKQALKKRYLNYFVITCNNQVLLEQRNGNDIWKGLYQLPLIETEKECSVTELLNTADTSKIPLHQLKAIKDVFRQKQKLTHQEIHFSIYNTTVPIKDYRRMSKLYLSVAIKDLNKYSFPKMLAYYVNNSLSST
jgi:A/G-specific adenine glycosylase